MSLDNRAGLVTPETPPVAREIYLLQRRTSKVGGSLGKTTGFGHRASLKKRKVNMINGVQYLKIDDEGLHVTINDRPDILEVDNVIICAGQVPFRALQEPLEAAGVSVHLIGGAELAAELDAKRAINQGARLAAKL